MPPSIAQPVGVGTGRLLLSVRALSGGVVHHPILHITFPEREAEKNSDICRDRLPDGLSERTLEHGGQSQGWLELQLERRSLVMVPVCRSRSLEPLEQRGSRPRGGGGRWRRNSISIFADEEGVGVHVVVPGECVVDHALREVGRGATFVLGEPVAVAATSGVRVPSPGLIRSRRHLGRAG